MRILSFAVLSLAFVASVEAAFNFGNCPTDITTVTFADYEALDTGSYDHRLLMLDGGIIAAITNLEALGFKFPWESYHCDDLATISPFKEISER